ncbi:MAG: glycerol-3-phosphate acyltransferase [Anaerolineales bacterium]|nr:glycerol-3-phosphate acyltransferase [Anaerolineales bacterium]
MLILKSILILLIAYLIGSIPFGLIVVKLKTGQDIRKIQSGRTGGTNAMRAAGLWAGIVTAALDILKGAAGVWIASAFFADDSSDPALLWLKVLAPVAAILGHNYSIFLLHRDETERRIRFHGGAGGAPAVGGALGLWAPSILIILPVGALIFFGIGYASITTMSVALIALIIFAVRAALDLGPWLFVLYGVLAELLLLWALRPNIRRLFNGTERLVGWRARRLEEQNKQPGAR